MRKLVKFLLFVGGIAVAVWYFKNELVPTPQSARGPVPHFRVPEHNGQASAPAPAAPEPQPPATGEPDDLTEVKGIGPVYAGKLADAGITTFAALATADAGAIADALDVSVEQVTDWMGQAKSLS